MGAIASLGHDVPALWEAICDARCGIRPLANIAVERLVARTGAEVQGFDAVAHFEARRLPMLDRCSQFALVAAREAMRQSLPGGLTACGLAPRRAGVIFGAGLGLESFDDSYKTLYGEGSNRLHPFTVPRIMPNAPASHIAIEFGVRGPSFAVASACASATHAIGVAFHMIRSGQVDLVITGGSDASITVGFIKAWEALRVLSPDTCRPFSKDRAGLVIGEGAGVLVLEAWEHAVARQATILGEVLGFGMTCDAGDVTAPDVDGASRAMEDALLDAEVEPAAVHYVNAHGTGTRLNDRTETAALRRVFGPHLDQLPVSSTKSMLGHALNAAGALEAVVTLLALRDGVVPPTIGYREPDPECAIDCVPNVARRAALDIALSNSFAFGGMNAVLVLGAAR